MVSIEQLQYLRENDHEKYLEEIDFFAPYQLPQKDRVMKYLKDFGSISPLEAMKDIGVMRLGARVWELVREGWEIVKDTECAQNRYGQDTRYARYRWAA